jgi:glutamate N-acetyltransferase/amino-acid N-acetyltransferase
MSRPGKARMGDDLGVPESSSPPTGRESRVELPQRFVVATGRAGLRESGDDVAIVVSTRPCASAGVFTKSLFAGASVALSRRRVAGGQCRGVVVVAKNANVATGDKGERNALEVAGLAATSAGVTADQMLIASTGVIGVQYPMELLRSHFASVRAGSFDGDGLSLARAMMTTDTRPKVASASVGPARVVGVAKGVGMIEPDMATMLAFVFTDAEVAPEALDRMWRSAVERSFNCLSVDSDTSTSDSALVFANGAAGPVDEDRLRTALEEICLELTLKLARDGEGATKLLVVTAEAARDDSQARRVAKAVLNSPLVKTAVHGADPNWGRVAMAVGKCWEQSDIVASRVVIRFGDLELYPAEPRPEDLQRLRRIMAGERVDITVRLGTGDASVSVYGCDLSADYVRINADYTT